MTCPDCQTVMKLEVLLSNAGYYLGRTCECGPYSRESIYFRTRDYADSILQRLNRERELSKLPDAFFS
jgi:hypothetical protein